MITLTDFNKETLEVFKHTMPNKFNLEENYFMFRAPNWIQVMHGLGMFNQDSIKKMWEKQPEYARLDIAAQYMRTQHQDSELATMKHRDHIEAHKGMMMRYGTFNTQAELERAVEKSNKEFDYEKMTGQK